MPNRREVIVAGGALLLMPSRAWAVDPTFFVKGGQLFATVIGGYRGLCDSNTKSCQEVPATGGDIKLGPVSAGDIVAVTLTDSNRVETNYLVFPDHGSASTTVPLKSVKEPKPDAGFWERSATAFRKLTPAQVKAALRQALKDGVVSLVGAGVICVVTVPSGVGMSACAVATVEWALGWILDAMLILVDAMGLSPSDRSLWAGMLKSSQFGLAAVDFKKSTIDAVGAILHTVEFAAGEVGSSGVRLAVSFQVDAAGKFIVLIDALK